MKFFVNFFLLALFTATTLSAQSGKEFSGDVDGFTKELSKFIGPSKDKSLKDTVSAFTAAWDAGAYTEGQKKQIIYTFQRMVQERQKTFPIVHDYLNALLAYKYNVADTFKFGSWHETLDNILNDKKREFGSFNKLMYGLLTSNALYDSPSRSWRTTSAKWNLIYTDQPEIQFSETDLHCFTKRDTISIYETHGTFYPFADEWIGKKGKVLWTRFGLAPDMVYAVFNEYRVNTTQSYYTVDSVEFYNKHHFGEPLIGWLEDKAYMDYKGEEGSYPRFTAFKVDFDIKDLAENVSYHGGFKMEGSQLQGIGNKDGKATIIITYKGVPTFKGESNIFILDPDKIYGNRVASTIYMAEDSMYHPQLTFQFLKKDREVLLAKKHEGLYLAPFSDSYHNLEMFYDGLQWKIDYPYIDMKLIANPEAEAIFESENYYTEARYERVQSILDVNPLDRVKAFSEYIDRRQFHIDELAQYLGSTKNNIERLVIFLSNEGFLFYDISSGEIITKDKLYHFVNANRDKADYDIIRFRSIISKQSNARLSLESFNLKLEGVPTALLSDSQRVYIVPKDQSITIKKDMEMEFDGHVHAGRFDFYGKKFKFDYGQFRIELDEVDSVKFAVPEVDPETGAIIMRQIKTVLQDVKGYLYIDHPFNKSGRKNFSEYPIFDCTKSAYVYYDNIYDGVYDRERFYFKIDPFKIDSLDNFVVQAMTFAGTFHSADILPDLKDELKVQDDYTLGIKSHSPPGGWPLYTGKGTGEIYVTMSNNGLRATGDILYLGSTTASDDIVFFPDSMNSNSKSYTIPDPGRDIYPKVDGRTVYTHWMPYQDSMYTYQRGNPFALYTENLVYKGNLVQTPTKLSGAGELNYKRSIMNSGLFEFYRQNLEADTARLRLIAGDTANYALESPSLKIDLNFAAQKLTATNNLNTTSTLLPQNIYATSLGNILWDINKDVVNFSAGSNQAARDAIFLSKKYEQDSLWFQSAEATLNLKDYLISARNVPLINVADGRVYPDSQKVYVGTGAKMRPLENAELKADTLHNLHRIYNAHLNIQGRLLLSGHGEYDYVDAYKNQRVITFDSIYVNRQEKKIAATANVPDTNALLLSPYFGYRGKVNLISNLKTLNYNGYVLPVHKFEDRQTVWFRYRGYLKPDSLYFTMDTVKNADKLDLYTGVYLATDSPHVYNTLTGRKKNYSDKALYEAKGILFYDDTRQAFVVADPEKLYNDSRQGSYYILFANTGAVTGEGKVSMFDNFEHIQTNSAGKVEFNPTDSQYFFDVVLTVNFEFDRNALKMMTDSIATHGFDLPQLDNNTEFVKDALAEIVPAGRGRDKLLGQIESANTIPADKELDVTFTFTNVRLVFDQQTKTIRSVGDLGLANVRNIPVNKQIPGAITVEKRRSSDKFKLYLEPRGYYFFDYNGGLFYISSSDLDYQDKVMETSKKVSKGKYRIRKGTKRQRDIFVRDLNL